MSSVSLSDQDVSTYMKFLRPGSLGSRCTSPSHRVLDSTDRFLVYGFNDMEIEISSRLNFKGLAGHPSSVGPVGASGVTSKF